MKNNFSILMSLYIKENPNYLMACLYSLYSQTITSDDIVIVHDGPLNKELYKVINSWKDKLDIKEVILQENVGLGMALNEGLKHCKYDLVARVDTDDINLPNRFDIQYSYMINNPNIALCGSHISEFDDNPDITISKRLVPIGDELNKTIFQRNPFNHMTVMFRKSAVLDAGGYQHLRFMEDYFLWVRMYLKGYQLHNLDTVFVNARIGNGMLERRKGSEYYKSELTFMNYLLKENIPNKPKVIGTFLVRSHLRLLPSSVLKKVYKLVRN
ncbi:TPA: glycosyltransferase [Photobacterium damselae]